MIAVGERVYGIQCSPSKDHNLSLLSSPHTQLQVLTPYFITALIPAYNFPCESYVLSISHDTFHLVPIQSVGVMSCACVYGPSPMRP